MAPFIRNARRASPQTGRTKAREKQSSWPLWGITECPRVGYTKCRTSLNTLKTTEPYDLNDLYGKTIGVFLCVCWSIDRSFAPARLPSHSIPKIHTEAYINYKLFGLLFRLITN